MKDGVFEVLSLGEAFRFRFFIHWFLDRPVLFGKERERLVFAVCVAGRKDLNKMWGLLTVYLFCLK